MKFNDIEELKPAFVRVVRADGIQVMFDYTYGLYYARDKSKYGVLDLEDYFNTLDSEHAVYEYHISLRSGDCKRVMLVFESDLEIEVIIRLSRLLESIGLSYIIKESGNRSLHLIVIIECESEEFFNEAWDSVLNLMSDYDKSKIDMNLRNYNFQIRGFESMHLKTNKVGLIIKRFEK